MNDARPLRDRYAGTWHGREPQRLSPRTALLLVVGCSMLGWLALVEIVRAVMP